MANNQSTAQLPVNDADRVSEELMATITMLVQRRLSQEGSTRGLSVSRLVVPEAALCDVMVRPARRLLSLA